MIELLIAVGVAVWVLVVVIVARVCGFNEGLK